MRRPDWKRLLAALAVVVAGQSATLAGIEWDSTEFDFGTIREADGIVRHAFVARNTGTDTITMTRIIATCGCTTADHRLPSAIPPGASDTLVIGFNPEGRPGRFDKLILVRFGKQQSQLLLKGKIIPSDATLDLHFPAQCGGSPLRLSALTVPVGEIHRGNARSAGISGYNASPDTLRLTVDGLPSTVQTAVMPETVAPGETFALAFYVRATPNAEFGLTEMPFTLRCSNNSPIAMTLSAIIMPSVSDLSRPDFAESQPEAAIATERINFDSIIGTKPLKRTFTLSNKGKAPLEIKGVTPIDNALSVSVDTDTIAPGGSATITATLHPAALKEDILNSQLIILTNDPLNPSIYVRVVGLRQ